MQPGWYPDPYSDGMLRWWDGTAWTANTMPNSPAPWAFRLDPRADLRGERAAGKRASITVAVSAVLSVVSSVLGVLVLGAWLRKLMRDFGDTEHPPTIDPARFVPFQAIEVVVLVLDVMFMLWLYRAATLARRASIPSRRDPVWAFAGFFVPVVNFWFPYQVAAGCFPPGDPLRRTAARWWTWYLLALAAGIAVSVATIFSEPVALVLCLAALAAELMYVREARVLIAAVESAHANVVDAAA